MGDEWRYGDAEVDKLKKAIEELANKVVNLAKQLDRHMNEADAHNPGTLKKKK